MGGYGSCPICRQVRPLTVHHDKMIGEKIMLCRPCHDIIETYYRYQQKVLSVAPAQAGP